MTLAQRIKQGLVNAAKKTIAPSSKIEYKRPKVVGLETESERRARKNKRITPPNGTVGRGSNGIGVGY